MYAIIKSGGKQYKVSEGDILNVDKLSKEPKETVEFAVVAVNNGDTLLTADAVANAKVTAEVVVEGRDKKVIIYKKRRRKDSKLKEVSEEASQKLELLKSQRKE